MIGDILLHNQKTYFSLGSLVSALQNDVDSTIILNEKIITQDCESSTVFSGENIPFTGSRTEIKSIDGGSQETSNIEYRDIGVSLSITPRIGEGDVITLKIEQSITEAPPNQNPKDGIRTTKSNTTTQVHMPDRSFVVLSGVVKNRKSQRKAGIPCLGGIPVIGAAFSKTGSGDEKKSLMIFAYPRIIHSDTEYQALTKHQRQTLDGAAPDRKAIKQEITSITQEEDPIAHDNNHPKFPPNKQGEPLREDGSIERRSCKKAASSSQCPA